MATIATATNVSATTADVEAPTTPAASPLTDPTTAVTPAGPERNRPTCHPATKPADATNEPS